MDSYVQFVTVPDSSETLRTRFLAQLWASKTWTSVDYFTPINEAITNNGINIVFINHMKDMVSVKKCMESFSVDMLISPWKSSAQGLIGLVDFPSCGIQKTNQVFWIPNEV